MLCLTWHCMCVNSRNLAAGWSVAFVCVRACVSVRALQVTIQEQSSAIANIFASYRKTGSRNTMLTSDFRPEVEICCFAHAQCTDHNYWNSSFIMGQIPRSTEGISSFKNLQLFSRILQIFKTDSSNFFARFFNIKR